MGNLCISLSQNASEGPNNGDLTSSPRQSLVLAVMACILLPCLCWDVVCSGKPRLDARALLSSPRYLTLLLTLFLFRVIVVTTVIFFPNLLPS